MIGTFITDQQSPYYESEKFTKVLEYIKVNHHIADMAEKNGKLRMRYENVKTISEALELLNVIM